jgi:valyl-tRNA synthetase
MERADKKKRLQAAQAKLDNPSFVSRAAPEVVQQQRDLAADLRAQIDAVEANLAGLRQA